MKFDTDLPSGLRAIEEHLESGTPLERNVSKDADEAFLRELEREDPQRFHRVVTNMLATGKAEKGKCQQCGLLLPFKDRRSDARYCDDACKKAAWRSRKAA